MLYSALNEVGVTEFPRIPIKRKDFYREFAFLTTRTFYIILLLAVSIFSVNYLITLKILL